MNKLAYMIFAMCIAISGCGMGEKSAMQEESAGESPVKASADAISINSEAVEEAIEEAAEETEVVAEEAEAVAEEVEEAVIPVKGSSGEIGVGSSIQE